MIVKLGPVIRWWFKIFCKSKANRHLTPESVIVMKSRRKTFVGCVVENLETQLEPRGRKIDRRR
jgi:hypothetical protein